MLDHKVIVREARDSDREAVIKVLVDAYQQYEKKLSEERWNQYKENILLTIDSSTTKSRLVAEVDSEVVGSVFIYDSAEAAYGSSELDIRNPIIRLLGVSQRARGFGVATELIRSSAKLSLEWGADTLHLHTSDMMDSAVRLYERLGFERAFDQEYWNGDLLVKSYRLELKKTTLLHV
ncbi:GNAT family N-acetyltransferase [Cohnella sp. WQ 127256]|uniref:GNAT family N-acetyltransferase n=1 Tax=Cohnella sp. WQ 127256 TaxID=2938790 RepID=UPI002117F948|nr:GNAT family N-acetyltransferase [Cohnella sp. WQ 127256]